MKTNWADWVDKNFDLVWGCGGLVILVVGCFALIWVAIHFIIKFW